MKKQAVVISIVALSLLACYNSMACTNILVTKGASTDGSNMISYAADSHQLFGELYFHPAAYWAEVAMLDVTEWDTGRFLGRIPQVPYTFKTVGNMNEHQLIIAETTYGGRGLADTTGIMDYGSLIYITLQRARTAREAIQTIVELANTYGYCSEGESFSIADKDEVWVMDLIGKGTKMENGVNVRKGIVYVARRVPDGYICAHANQARITTFPKDDPDNCLYAPDVISFAREKGYYSGDDADFSFCDAYAPLNFSAMRACEARVWSFFRTFADDMDKYVDYAMGYNAANRMPLWVKPAAKISPKQVFDAMRDHFEGTPMDMTKDLGAGGHGLPYRWRPMSFEVDGKEYINERATATQQTGFWMVGQARPGKTGILWFGVDDAATSCLTPIYCNTTEVPECFAEGNGSMLEYSPTSAFWLFNRVTNFAYLRYDMMSADIRKVVDFWERSMLEAVAGVDWTVEGMSPKQQRKHLTQFSVNTAQVMFENWTRLDKYLLIKYMDGNVKSEHDDVLRYVIGEGGDASHFVDNGNGRDIPDDIQFPGYNDKWKRAVVEDNGEVLQAR